MNNKAQSYIQLGTQLSHDQMMATSTNSANPLQNSPWQGSGFPNIHSAQGIQQAYNIKQIQGLNGLGTGINVCVVIAYHYANLQIDFDNYCIWFGLPRQTLNIFQMPNMTAGDWSWEECLDVQMIHAVAPNASISVVEAASNSYADMFAAVNKANTFLGTNGKPMDVISMSWGSAEFAGQLALDTKFSRNNCCYVVSSGDTAGIVSFPSSSQHALCVGGTRLTKSSDSKGNFNPDDRTETPWAVNTNGSTVGGGCGISAYYHGLSCAIYPSLYRACVDVSAVADPSTGFIVCHGSTVNQTFPPFYYIGGTSASAPLWAGIVAIMDQVRVSKNQPKFTTLNGDPNDIKAFLYALPSGPAFQTSTYGPPYQPIESPNFLNWPALNDITVDNPSGPDGGISAGPGYDLPCGKGSANVYRLLQFI